MPHTHLSGAMWWAWRPPPGATSADLRRNSPGPNRPPSRCCPTLLPPCIPEKGGRSCWPSGTACFRGCWSTEISRPIPMPRRWRSLFRVLPCPYPPGPVIMWRMRPPGSGRAPASISSCKRRWRRWRTDSQTIWQPKASQTWPWWCWTMPPGRWWPMWGTPPRSANGRGPKWILPAAPALPAASSNPSSTRPPWPMASSFPIPCCRTFR